MNVNSCELRRHLRAEVQSVDLRKLWRVTNAGSSDTECSVQKICPHSWYGIVCNVGVMTWGGGPPTWKPGNIKNLKVIREKLVKMEKIVRYRVCVI